MTTIKQRLLEYIYETNEPFVSIIAEKQKNGKMRILAKGKNCFHNNPLKHSEIDAIENLFHTHGRAKPTRKLTLFSSAEPCVMCAAAIVYAGIPRIKFAVDRNFLSVHGWDEINMSCKEIFKQAKDFIEVKKIQDQHFQQAFLKRIGMHRL